MCRSILFLVIVTVPWGCKLAEKNDAPNAEESKLPAEVHQALAKAEEIELYSLDPSREGEQPKDGLHGWKVLGKTTLKGENLKKAIAAIEQGARDSDGSAAACFIPRHGVRVKVGNDTIDLVICFQCHSTTVYRNAERAASFLTAATPQPTLNAILRDAGIPLPKPAS